MRRSYVWHLDFRTRKTTFGEVPLVIACDACPSGSPARECILDTNDQEVHSPDCGCPNAGKRVWRQQLLCLDHHWLTIPYYHRRKGDPF